MPIQCRLIDPPKKDTVLQVGDMWYGDMIDDEDRAKRSHIFLTEEYWRDNADQRLPIWVVLPDKTRFLVDGKAAKSEDGWIVTGEAPNITVNPSIDSQTWHGYLRDGVLTDDLDGRTYPPA